MTEYRKQKRQREARQKSEALLLADDPLADEIVSEPVTEVEEIKEKEKKYYDYYGGVTSFEELDAYLKTQEEVEQIESTTYQFRTIIDNILYDSEIEPAEKAVLITSATEAYKKRLSSSEKGMLEKFKDYVSAIFSGKKEHPGEADNSLQIITQKDGSKRWFGQWSNNYMDREKEIISSEAHKEFAAYLKEYPDRMPAFWSWHIKGTTRQSDADYVDYIDGFMVASGPLTAEEAEQLERAIAYDKGKTGMSHGMYVLERDPERKEIITKYRTYEISDLPLANAANGFTSITSIKEAKMTDEKFNRLAESIGVEAASKIIDQIGESKEALEALGVESKESEVADAIDKLEAEPVVEEEKPEEEIADEEKEVKSPAIKEIAVAISKELGLSDLSEYLAEQDKSIKALTETVEKLSKEDDEKIAEQFEDKSLGALIWKKRASESEETVVTDENEIQTIKEQTPTSWVTDALGAKN